MNKLLLITIFIVVFILYVVKRKYTDINLFSFTKRDLFVEGLQNFDEPVMEPSEFLSKITDKNDADFGSIVKDTSKNFNYKTFYNETNYSEDEVERDIKYFNNASHLIIGFKYNDSV